ncbi:NADH:flavin oxidoreductase [Sphingobium sp. AN558]|uniref:NADH:flavin oxidoreductase n=1 Tax=Sphingobium sp. AN558 TaxID=3133442 RepID=UPI0030BBD44C
MILDKTIDMAARIEGLFRPFDHGSLHLENRIVMAPMTRCFSPDGVPGEDVARYYRRRAEGGVGLIITEGTWIPHPSASNEPDAPRFYGEDALAGWKRVVDGVHAAGGKMMPQLWHVGQTVKTIVEGVYNDEDTGVSRQVGPSGYVGGIGVLPRLADEPATQQEIDEVTAAYAHAARSAYELGFDGVELHAAHGYLFDQFFWNATNKRDDIYGGDIAQRTRFAVDVVREIRRATSPDFPIVMRISQWKLHDYRERLVHSPDELARFLAPLTDAGVDMFHCSQRRFWEGEFGSDRNLAAWVRELSGKPSITVGSVTLQHDLMANLKGDANQAAPNLEKLLDMFERGDFDLVAVGRSLLANPDWPAKIRAGALDKLEPFTQSVLTKLD